ncbi:YALI0E10153p [Yarrowia lipolytica CLIB122]|uniref:YALI0E10153p n=2 Tax=Yarrowia lipolytica TaxID=4952 RepID=Q6C6E5_YARLI|nr:YALI0E10153p [Yarrowia lipolytica CLIB122]AOW05214.1 hypothetical protein YALI1_E12747g [Yarrowia lipolytica]KAE8173395.1 hypothetical protein BKA90DRAFT_109879 [Yarrowia lipolytica]KAJ8056744.1 hypothetical protein LXG23DRAFT_53459 [Yarrowia lipolytica]RMI98389.1 hypothetical protein BD777DRAFT_113966 [Yarrowia lipolytica]CAG79358.1 YALI0E10153p [Yarrowia lipolytica CLIB122]|eukprot:XP_503767.1 YALI0E10153p [Yarrowia lipolytica CLIB122]
MRRINVAVRTVGLGPRYDYKALVPSIQMPRVSIRVPRRAFSALQAPQGGLQFIQDILLAEEPTFLHLVQEVIEQPIREGKKGPKGAVHKLQMQKLRVLARIKHMNLGLEEQVRMVAANRLIDHSSLLQFWETCSMDDGGDPQLPLSTAILLGQQMVADGEFELVADFLANQFSFGDILMLGGRVIADGGPKNKQKQVVTAFELCRAFDKHGFAQQLAREFWIGNINGGLHFCLGLDSCATEQQLQDFLYHNDRINYRLSKYNSGAFILEDALKPYEKMRLLEKYVQLGNTEVLRNLFFNQAAEKHQEWIHACIERVIRMAITDSRLLGVVKDVLEKKNDLPVWCTARVTALVTDQKSLRSLWARYTAQYAHLAEDETVKQTMVTFLEKAVALGDIHSASSITKVLGENTPIPLVKQYLHLLFNNRLHKRESDKFDLITRLLDAYSSHPSVIMKAVGAVWPHKRYHKSEVLLWDLLRAFEASKLPHWSQLLEKHFALAIFTRPPVEKVEYYFLPKVSVRAIWLCIQTELSKAMEAVTGDVDRSGRLQLITIALMAIRIKSRRRRFQRGHFLEAEKEESEVESDDQPETRLVVSNPYADLDLSLLPPRAQLERLQIPSEYLKIRDLDMFLLQHIGKQEKPFSQLVDMDQWIYDVLSVETYKPNLETLSVEDPALAYRLIRWFRHDFMFPIPPRILRAMVPGFATSEQLTNSMSFRYISEVISQLRLQHERVGPEVCEELVDSLFDRVALPGASRDKKRLQWALTLAKQEQVDEQVVERWNKRLEDMKKRQDGFWKEA